ncbi:hypothetical protein MiSe_72830 [Microseira wollei NIES-4236]|uniref:Uncharacterized protein n=1 Tax=Microseira wollei NIES-4236 TaxID=2530354 RepID=A0AAV3XLP4_9CYAN|nr:hypothetical protein MiSe_72830 [Microseira wollei NIES-4236]
MRIADCRFKLNLQSAILNLQFFLEYQSLQKIVEDPVLKYSGGNNSIHWITECFPSWKTTFEFRYVEISS